MLHITIQNIKLFRNVALTILASLQCIYSQIATFPVKYYVLIIQKDKMRNSDFHFKGYDLIISHLLYKLVYKYQYLNLHCLHLV